MDWNCQVLAIQMTRTNNQRYSIDKLTKQH